MAVELSGNVGWHWSEHHVWCHSKRLRQNVAIPCAAAEATRYLPGPIENR